jgi:DUF4097 and DUF4098 domain-containing protein YvlB
MNKSLKGVAIAAAAMVTVGILLTGIGWMAGGNQPVYFDNKGIHVGERGNSDYGTLESFYQNVDNFSSIDADLDYYDVDLVPGDKFAVEGTFYSKDGKPDVKVADGTLIIRDKDRGRININIDFPGLFNYDNQPRITIYYPKNTELKDLVLKCDASDLQYENLVITGRADLELDFGSLDINGLSAKNVKVSMDSGSCTLKKIKADDLNVANNMGKTTVEDADLKTLKIDADSGEISLTGVTADQGELTADMGRINGKDMATKGLKVDSSSGEVVLEGKLFGLTDIASDMGAVTVNPGAPKEQFNYELNTDMGSVSIGGDGFSGNVAMNNASAKNTLKIKTDMGSIKVNFD